MSQKILVPLDRSSHVEPVLAAAVAQASWRGADLVLLRALSLPMALPPEAYALAPNDVAGLLEATARTDLAAVAATLPPDVATSVRVEFGGAWQVICEVAKSEDVALVVIGAHDRRMLDGILGTTTTRVVNHAARSVLVVRGP